MEIAGLYGKVKERILYELETIQRISVVADVWSKKGLSESYLGVLVKYIQPGTSEVRLVFLALKKLHGSHTVQNIYDALNDVLSAWNISEDKVMYYITDNGSNMIKALKECIIEYGPLSEMVQLDGSLEDEFQMFEEGDVNLNTSFVENEANADLAEFEMLEYEFSALFNSPKRLACIAHCLANVMRKCVDKSKTLRPIIASAFNLVKGINKSTLNKEQLLRYNGRGLLSPSQTRWIYTDYVLDRLLESKEAVERVIVDKELNEVALDPLKWKQIAQIRDLLAPFASAVKELEGDRYATLSQVIPTLVDLIESMKERGKGSGGFGSVASEIQKEMEIKFAYVLDPNNTAFQPAYMLATFLDQRFVIGLSNGQQTACIGLILRLLSNGADYDQGHNPLSGPTAQQVEEKYGGFFKIAQIQRSISQPTNDERLRLLKAKLESYVSERMEAGPVIISESSINSPLGYWFERRDTHKELAYFAMDLLAVPASSAGIERVFSIASRVQGNRFRLGAQATENELMIKINRQFLLLMSE